MKKVLAPLNNEHTYGYRFGIRNLGNPADVWQGSYAHHPAVGYHFKQIYVQGLTQ
jgi:hypothetical protein